MKLILLTLFIISPVPARAAGFAVTLKAAEESALSRSNTYRSAKFSAEAAKAAASAAGAPLRPRIALEGSARYSGVVPEISLPAATGGGRPLGDNWNYSLGPSAYWTLFDGGARRFAYESALHGAASRSAEAEHVRRQVILKARTAYFRLRLALERVYIMGETLQLSLAQLKDVSLGARTGFRSRLDEIRARQETDSRKRDLLRARAELAASLRDFSFDTGVKLPGDASLPMDARMAGRDYGDAPAASMFIESEPYDAILARMRASAGAALLRDLPAVKALAESGMAYEARAAAYKAERSPRLILGARSSLDYPNGPNLYSFLQNSASLTLNLPLFESGRSADREKENDLDRAAALERKDEAVSAAGRDYYKALDAYNALAAEQEINVAALDDAAEAAKLAYDAYKAGSGTWLEVETANLKALRARTTAAEADAEMLLNLAVLDSLTDGAKERI